MGEIGRVFVRHRSNVDGLEVKISHDSILSPAFDGDFKNKWAADWQIKQITCTDICKCRPLVRALSICFVNVTEEMQGDR